MSGGDFAVVGAGLVDYSCLTTTSSRVSEFATSCRRYLRALFGGYCALVQRPALCVVVLP